MTGFARSFRRWRLLLVVAVVMSVTPGASVFAVEHIEINTNRDPRFLPYAVKTVQFIEKRSGEMPLKHSCRVIEPAIEGVSAGLLAQSWNSHTRGESAQVGFRSCLESGPVIDDNGLWLTLLDQRAFIDTASGLEGVVLLGTRNDSLFLARVCRGSGKSEVYITSGVDLTGDSVWSGEAYFLKSGDFDDDGHLEVIGWNGAKRDLRPRLLFSIQVEPLAVEWTVPSASPVNVIAFYPATRTRQAQFLALAPAPANGAADTLFSDSLAYLFGVSVTGRILSHRIIGGFAQWVDLLHMPDAHLTYVAHPRDFSGDTTGSPDEYIQGCRLTQVDRDGKPIRSISLGKECQSMWAADYNGDGVPEVNVMYANGSMAVYDTSLSLLVRSGPTSIHHRISDLSGWGEEGTVQVMATPRGTEIYSNRFENLAALNGVYLYVEPTAYTSSGTIDQFHATNFEHTDFFHPRKVGWLTYASILYVDYQPYILSILFGLVVGLVTVNHYRRRTRSNLNLIEKQKEELETTHAALEETHAALQQAQAQIIAQEKYRQARDIAGGFAHEIRNALFPARVSIAKARTKREIDAIVASLSSIDQAVGRAIDITGLITTYTRAESEVHPEPVDLQQIVGQALKDNRMRIENENVAVRVDARPTPEVRGNRAQLVLVVDNLIRNSLDALVDIDSPEILITVRSAEGRGEIRVEDNGPGVPESDRERIFDMFYSTKPRTGTGVGLALSRKIVSLYDGTLTCESSQGGACIVLRLPLADQPD